VLAARSCDKTENKKEEHGRHVIWVFVAFVFGFYFFTGPLRPSPLSSLSSQFSNLVSQTSLAPCFGIWQRHLFLFCFYPPALTEERPKTRGDSWDGPAKEGHRQPPTQGLLTQLLKCMSLAAENCPDLRSQISADTIPKHLLPPTCHLSSPSPSTPVAHACLTHPPTSRTLTILEGRSHEFRAGL
jgi:hypothetical protein